MQDLEDYQHLEKIYESNKTIIYRGLDEKNNRPVILKKLNREYPTPEETSNFFREYELISKFENEGVIQTIEKSGVDNSPLIIMEDIGGKSLAELLPSRQLNLKEILNLCIRITEILGNIHKHNIIHKDINPSNIIWNIEKDNIQIIDFGLGTELTREITSIKNPNILEGTLPYISPEQTGRMNRSMDYRTDYYSLGITFYWMLTGKLPFESTDPLQLVHSHIAIQPNSPHNLDENIPEIISGIIMKLMAKNSEDRYQSTFGLIFDLEHCIQDLQKKGVVGIFELGMRDVSTKFQISQKLYGREKEIETLLSSFEKVSGGKTELMLVSGFSGIGKSVLINEIQRPIEKYGGYFISGKFEKLKRDIPYSGIIQAFTELARQILAEKEERISFWKNSILSAIGSNGKIITDIIPLFELIIGKQKDVAHLGPIETQNRFNRIFHDFIKILASKEHPLIIFLDNLQWSDPDSLHLIKLCTIDSKIKHLFIIGTYRQNETPESHPLILILEEIEKTGKEINNIYLPPLNMESVMCLLSDTLYHPEKETRSLAELLIRKTDGNPFFLIEFLKSLYNKGLIEYSTDKGWRWNNTEINEMQITENVVDLLAEKISDFSDDIQEILKIGACIGNYFNLITFFAICKKSKEKILSALKVLLQEGMLYRIDNIYRFSHNRVQEAAYSLISNKEKIHQHYCIGNLELKNTEEENLPNKIFYIINQLNAGRSLITDNSEKIRIAELNLIAGKKALTSNAYISALNYLKVGIELLQKNCWEDNYDFTLSIYQVATSAAQLCAEYEAMEKFSGEVINNATTILDKIKVYEAKIYACIARNQLKKGTMIGLNVLKKLGITIPVKPYTLRIIYELVKLKLLLLGKPIGNLMGLPLMKEPQKLAIMQILSGIGTAAYWSVPEIVPLLSFHTIRLSIKYGNNFYSPYCYGAFGLVHCSILGKINKGYEWGKLALNLVEKNAFKNTKARVWVAVWYLINHWKKPIQDCIKPLNEAYRIGQETGDLEFAAISAGAYTIMILHSGMELNKVEKKTVKYAEAILYMNQDRFLTGQLIHHQFILNLLGESENPCKLSGLSYDFNKMLVVHEKTKDYSALSSVYYYLLVLNYLFGNNIDALENTEKIKLYIDALVSSPYIPLHNFYDSLIRLALFPLKKGWEQKKLLFQVTKNQKKLKKWAFHSPMNYLHKYYLVEAETARVLGKELKAIRHYNNAAKLAQENKFIQEEALSLELTAKFWLGLKEEKNAAIYMTEAINKYRIWGATAKVKYIKNKYPNLLTGSFGKSYPISATDLKDVSSSTSSQTSTQILDLTSLLKASTILSGEIVLDKLLEKMMRIVMENAGADKGIFILKQGENWYIEAEGSADLQDFKILNILSLNKIDDREIVPQTVINFVIHSSTDLVLEDAAERGNFANDPYIMENKTKSILCMPLIHKGNINAILYLENNSLSNAFTNDRIEILKMLSSQMAVSLENTTMYAQLEDLVDERTQELNFKNEVITKKNEDILDSIRYAERIQRSMLPDPEVIKSLLPNSFFLWQPKDIVGGDAYYIEPVEKCYYISVFDCTGHGVPGAMMTMVATVFLRRIIVDYKSITPSAILKQLNMIIKNFFKQDKEETLSDDGLDAAICFVNPGEKKLIYAGAKLSLYYQDHNQIVQIKGDKQSIGYKRSKEDFDYTDHEIHIQDNSVFYMSTDGYIDQIGGEKNLPFGWKKFIKLLQENQNESMKKQCKKLKSSIAEYKGEGNPQVDDITVLGFKV